MMQSEIQKLSILKPLYEQAKKVLPQLEVSQQNLRYYASLANYHSVYELRRLLPSQAYLSIQPTTGKTIQIRRSSFARRCLNMIN